VTNASIDACEEKEKIKEPLLFGDRVANDVFCYYESEGEASSVDLSAELQRSPVESCRNLLVSSLERIRRKDISKLENGNDFKSDIQCERKRYKDAGQHSYRVDALMLRGRKNRKSCKKALQFFAFCKLVKQLVQEEFPNSYQHIRFKTFALNVLHESSKAYLLGIMDDVEDARE